MSAKISQMTDGLTANFDDKIPIIRDGLNLTITPGYINSATRAATRTALKALNPVVYSSVYLEEGAHKLNGGRAGVFVSVLKSTLTAAEQTIATADTLEGVYVSSTANALYLYKRVFDGSLIVEWFGADPTKTVDAVGAINAALRMAIQMNLDGMGVFEVILTGVYRIDSPVEIFKRNGSGWDYARTALRGRGRSYGNAGLFPTYKDRPAIIYNSVRSLQISNITMVGKANNFATPDTYDALLNDAVNPWWNQGNARDERYTPHCGIAGDPFGSSVPPEGAYPGYETFYTSSAGSSNVHITQCEAWSFVVGYAASLGLVALGDSHVYDRCIASSCKVGYAIGQAQNRAIKIKDSHSVGTQMFIDCVRYGQGIGAMPVVDGGCIVYCKWLLLGNPGYSAAYISGLYAESIFSLGLWNGLRGFPITFSGCTFKFIPGSDSRVADYHFFSGPEAYFVGCSLTTYNGEPHRLSFSTVIQSGQLKFESCTFDAPPILSNIPATVFSNVVSYYDFGLIDDHIQRQSVISDCSIFVPFAGKATLNFGQSSQRTFEMLAHGNDYSLGGVTLTVSGINATFTTSSPGLLKVGDYIVTNTDWAVENPGYSALLYAGEVSIGRIASIVGTTVTLVAVPISIATGTYSLKAKRYTRIQERTIGTTTSGSPDITAVSSGSVFAVGDSVRGVGIPDGASVLAVVGTTLTMSINATASGTVAIYDAVAKVRGVGTAAPSSGVWFKGDQVDNTGVYVNDGNNMVLLGWVCTVSGSPGTWVAQYNSSISPAT